MSQIKHLFFILICVALTSCLPIKRLTTSNQSAEKVPQVDVDEPAESQIEISAVGLQAVADEVGILEDSGEMRGHLKAIHDGNTTVEFRMLGGSELGEFILLDPTSGLFSFTPHGNRHGVEEIEFEVVDSIGNRSTAVLQMEVRPINDAPSLPSLSLNTKEDRSVSSTLQGSDVDGDSLTYSVLETGAARARLALDANTGQFTYTPAKGFVGTETYTITASDGSLNATAPLKITVINVADIPVALTDSFSSNEDLSLIGKLRATDADGDPLTYSQHISPKNGKLKIERNGSFSYTPNADYAGDDSFFFVANDGLADSNPARISLKVLPINDAPELSSLDLTTKENQALNGTLIGRDVDGDTLTYSVIDSDAEKLARLNLNASNGEFTYTPANNFFGKEVYSVTVTDGTLSTSASLTIDVTNVADIPVAQADTFSVDEDTLLAAQLKATDSDGDALTYKKHSDPEHGTLDVKADGKFTYTPNQDYAGSDRFSFVANDGKTDSNPATITLTVRPINDAPTLADLSLTTKENEALSKSLVGRDVDGDSLTYSVDDVDAAKLQRLALDSKTGNFTYTPAKNFVGKETYTVSVADGTVSTKASLSIEVTNVPDAPIAQADSFSLLEDTTLTGQLKGTDADGDPLTYKKHLGPDHGVLSIKADGSFTYTPNLNYNGPDSFLFVVNDGSATSSPAEVSLTIAAVNDPPTVNAMRLSGIAGNKIEGQATATDIDGDAMTFSLLENVTTPSITSKGAISYQSEVGATGTKQFTLQVSDGTVTSRATLTIEVQAPQNRAPIAQKFTATTPEDQSKSVQLLGSDPENSPLKYSLVGNNVVVNAAADTALLTHANGTVTLNQATGEAVYTPKKDYFGSFSFQYRVNDGELSSDPAQVTIAVTSVNDAPVAHVQPEFSTDEDTVLQKVLDVTDVDGNGQAPSIVVKSAPQHGRVVFDEGEFIYTPNRDYFGKDTFNYTAKDRFGAESNEVTVSINVEPKNDPPSLPPTLSGRVSENRTVFRNTFATDPDGDTLSLVGRPKHGFYSYDRDTRKINYTPKSGLSFASGSVKDTFTVTAVDFKGGSAKSEMTITIERYRAINAANSVGETNRGTSLTKKLQIIDSNRGTVTQPWGLKVLKAPDNGAVTLDATTLEYTYTPSPGFSGEDSFRFEADDGASRSDAKVTLTVWPIDDTGDPIAKELVLSVDEDWNLTADLPKLEEGDSTYRIVQNPGQGEVIELTQDGKLTYRPKANYFGLDGLVYSTNNNAVGHVKIRVKPVNDAPVADPIKITTKNTATANIVATDVDSDDGALVYLKGSEPSQGTYSIIGNELRYRANETRTAETDSFTILVKDAEGAVSAPIPVSVTLLPDTDKLKKDLTFGTDGVVITHVTTKSQYWTIGAPLSDGGLLTAGYSNIAKYLPNGELDEEFGEGGLSVEGYIGGPLGIRQLPNGDIIVLNDGFRDEPSGIRFSSDGLSREDIAKEEFCVAENQCMLNPRGLGMQADGKYIVVGEYKVDLKHHLAFIRFNQDGTIDTSFKGGDSTTGGLSFFSALVPGAYRSTVLVQPDGKILAAAEDADGDYAGRSFGLVRLLPNGTPDTSFGENGFAFVTKQGHQRGLPKIIRQLTDGSYVLAPENLEFLVRLSSEGQAIFDVNVSGIQGVTPFESTGGGLWIDDEDNIHVVGRLSKYNPPREDAVQMWTVSLRSDGSPRNIEPQKIDVNKERFRVNHVITLKQSGHVAMIGGAVEEYSKFDPAVYNLQTKKLTLKPLGKSGHQFLDMAEQPSGKILTLVNYHGAGTILNIISRFNADGSLDTTFANEGHLQIPSNILEVDSVTGNIFIAHGGRPAKVIVYSPDGVELDSEELFPEKVPSGETRENLYLQIHDVAARDGKMFVFGTYESKGRVGSGIHRRNITWDLTYFGVGGSYEAGAGLQLSGASSSVDGEDRYLRIEPKNDDTHWRHPKVAIDENGRVIIAASLLRNVSRPGGQGGASAIANTGTVIFPDDILFRGEEVIVVNRKGILSVANQSTVKFTSHPITNNRSDFFFQGTTFSGVDAFNNVLSATRRTVIRYTPSGERDSNFLLKISGFMEIRGLLTLSNGKVIVARANKVYPAAFVLEQYRY